MLNKRKKMKKRWIVYLGPLADSKRLYDGNNKKCAEIIAKVRGAKVYECLYDERDILKLNEERK